MTGHISPTEAKELIVAVNKEEEPPKKKMEVLEDFVRRYGDFIAADGRRMLQEELTRLSYL